MEQIQRIKFLVKKNPIVVLIGKKTEILRRFIEYLILKESGQKKDIIILECPEEKLQDFKFYLQRTEFGVIILKDEVKNFDELLNFLKELPPKINLIFNFEEKKQRKLKDLVNLHSLSFGMDENADIFISSLKLNFGMNIKISFGGSIVPFWLEGVFGKEYILSLLASVAFGVLNEMNLVEISQYLKDFTGVPGKKRLIEGISGSFLLDDSKSFEETEQKEALEILKEIQWAKRKICILDGEINQEIFVLALKICDLIFLFDEKFVFEEREKLLFFDKIENGMEKLKKTLKENDLVLILGSQKINFEPLIDNIRKIW
jgi:UDP-N-acetylmuramyl pentapeptide synthase